MNNGLPRYPRKWPPGRVFYNWEITHFCNYDCPYCNVYSEETDFRIGPDEYFRAWTRIFENYGTGHIRLSGGEPSSHPEIIGILGFLTRYFPIEISTNLTFDVGRFMNNVNPDTILISSSFHPHRIEFENFLEKISVLKNNRYNISVTYVVFPGHNGRIHEYKEACESRGIEFILQVFSGWRDGRHYPEAYSEKEKLYVQALAGKSINPANKAIVATKMSRPEDSFPDAPERIKRECLMGAMYAKILPDGNAYRCCVSDSAFLGNIFDEGLVLLDGPQECNSPMCPCYKAMITGAETQWLKYWNYREHPVYPTTGAQ